jgi:hypothetical protein
MFTYPTTLLAGEASPAEASFTAIPYAYLTLSADQSANMTVGNHVEFDQLAQSSGAGFSLSTGAGQADGVLTVPAGTWEFRAQVGMTNAGGGESDWTLYDDVAATIIGTETAPGSSSNPTYASRVITSHGSSPTNGGKASTACEMSIVKTFATPTDVNLGCRYNAAGACTLVHKARTWMRVMKLAD